MTCLYLLDLSVYHKLIAFVLCTGYFAGNFHAEHYMLIPLGAILGLLGGPLWSAIKHEMIVVTYILLSDATPTPPSQFIVLCSP
jgi:hypothetical protein